MLAVTKLDINTYRMFITCKKCLLNSEPQNYYYSLFDRYFCEENVNKNPFLHLDVKQLC